MIPVFSSATAESDMTVIPKGRAGRQLPANGSCLILEWAWYYDQDSHKMWMSLHKFFISSCDVYACQPQTRLLTNHVKEGPLTTAQWLGGLTWSSHDTWEMKACEELFLGWLFHEGQICGGVFAQQNSAPPPQSKLNIPEGLLQWNVGFDKVFLFSRPKLDLHLSC